MSEQERWCNLASALIIGEAREMNGYDEENEVIDISIDMLSLCAGIERDVLIKFISDGIKDKRDITFGGISNVIGQSMQYTRILWKRYIGAYSHKEKKKKKYLFSQREVDNFLNRYYDDNKTTRRKSLA
jgi:hypothetical protein